jgi:rhomboid family GlyGly-CTERM serine protease
MRPAPRLQVTDWWLPAVILVLLLAVMLAGEPAAAVLRYERAGVLEGELWRLLTGHLVHADVPHLMWNILGLALVFALFAGAYSPGEWLAVMLASTAAIDLGFLALEPRIAWYVGLSGVLHGLMAAGLVAWLKQQRDPLIVSVTVLFVGKLIWEHVNGPLPLTAETLTIPVVYEAHSYGAIGGTLCAIALVARRRRTPANPPL